MKTIRDVMTADIIRLSPTNKIKTAIILMKGHNIGGLPVLEDDRVVGVLDYHDILGKDNDILVQNIMDREFVTVPPDLAVGDAASLMTKTGTGRLLVMEGNQLVGVVTRGDLLPELGKSFDPITGLPRADSMRDWGIDALKRGQEITVIFIDLDQFGQFNKKYGHIMGDKVLKHVAQTLQTLVDEEQDILCRYAGDEFVIVTTRICEEAGRLADTVGESIADMVTPELPEPVTGSLGLHGGKRTKEREHVHFEATLDNLINLASKSCTLAKSYAPEAAMLDGAGPAAPVTMTAVLDEPLPEPETYQEHEPSAPAPIAIAEEFPLSPHKRLKIQGLNLSWGIGTMATAEVELANNDIVRKRSRSGFALGNNALRLVAEATAEVVCEFLPGTGYAIIPESVNLIHGIEEDVVLVTVLLATPKTQMRISGSSMVKQDAYKAAATALLNAVNRLIANLI